MGPAAGVVSGRTHSQDFFEATLCRLKRGGLTLPETLCYSGRRFAGPERGIVDQRYWIGFNRIKGIGAIRFRRLLDAFGDLENAWNASPAALRDAGLDR